MNNEQRDLIRLINETLNSSLSNLSYMKGFSITEYNLAIIKDLEDILEDAVKLKQFAITSLKEQVPYINQ